MTTYPPSYTSHLKLLVSLHDAGNYRLRDQLAYHLSKAVRDDLFYTLTAGNAVAVQVSAKYLLIHTMNTLGVYTA